MTSIYLTELDVVNMCLGTMGETPLNALVDDHPFIAAARSSLRVVNNREQSKGWWFNQELVTLSPDPSSKNIMLPLDAIRVDPIDPSKALVQRGRRLFDPATSSYSFLAPVKVRLIRGLPFEDLPPSAQSYVGISATLDFCGVFDADSRKVANLVSQRGEAYTTLHAEHIRNQNVNMLTRPSMANALARLGTTAGMGGILN